MLPSPPVLLSNGNVFAEGDSTPICAALRSVAVTGPYSGHYSSLYSGRYVFHMCLPLCSLSRWGNVIWRKSAGTDMSCLVTFIYGWHWNRAIDSNVALWLVWYGLWCYGLQWGCQFCSIKFGAFCSSEIRRHWLARPVLFQDQKMCGYSWFRLQLLQQATHAWKLPLCIICNIGQSLYICVDKLPWKYAIGMCWGRRWRWKN